MFGLNPYLILFVVIAVLSSLGGMYVKGRIDCSNSYQTKELIAELEGVKNRDEIEAKVIRLTDSDLDKRWSRWLRDAS